MIRPFGHAFVFELNNKTNFKIVTYLYEKTGTISPLSELVIYPVQMNIPEGYTAVSIKTFSSGQPGVIVRAARVSDGQMALRNDRNEILVVYPELDVLCVKTETIVM